MNTRLQLLQTELDEVKQDLVSNSEYAALSGMNMLPRNWTVDPCLCSMETGIRPKENDENQVTHFLCDFKGVVKKHNIDDCRPCGCRSSTTLTLSSEIPSGEWKALSGYTDQEKQSIAEQLKNNNLVEEYMTKRAEFDFLKGVLKYIKEEDLR